MTECRVRAGARSGVRRHGDDDNDLGQLETGRYQQTEHQTRWRKQSSRPRRELRLSACRYRTRTSAYRYGAVTPERRQQIHKQKIEKTQYHGAGDGNRTRIASLEGWSSTI